MNDECEDKRGVVTWKEGSRYVGGFVKGKRQGRGNLVFAKVCTHEGDFINNKYDGMGSCRYEDGRVYFGLFERGKAHGQKLTDSHGAASCCMPYEGR